VLAGLALMKEVKRINTTIVRNPVQEQYIEFVLRQNLYTIEVDQRRNCYSYWSFGHLA